MPEARRLRGVGIGADVRDALSGRLTQEQRARALMEQYGIPRFHGDWKEMLDVERPDFVDIITPPETHEEMCAFAAARGIHLI